MNGRGIFQRILCALHLRTCNDCIPDDHRIVKILGRTEKRADRFIASGNWAADMVVGAYRRNEWRSDDADGAPS